MTDLPLPLTQSHAFERTCVALNLTVKRVQSDAGTCLIQSRTLPVIGGFHLVSRGPVAAKPESAAELLQMMRQMTKGPLVINAPARMPTPRGLKIAAGADLAILDLSAPGEMRARMHQKWRNQLNKAERSPLRVTHEALDLEQHRWFLDAESTQQKSRRYKSYPTGFLLAYAATNPGEARMFIAKLGQAPVAGLLVLKHGLMATYQAGVTTLLGRQHCAHNLLLWNAMQDLQAQGCLRLDLGRTDLSPGLKRFKTSSGARIEQLAGSFLSHSWLTRRELQRPEYDSRIAVN
ncbi:MAG: GNAT family N-acetyltransferase [Pseudomonadota bacterium]